MYLQTIAVTTEPPVVRVGGTREDLPMIEFSPHLSVQFGGTRAEQIALVDSLIDSLLDLISDLRKLDRTDAPA